MGSKGVITVLWRHIFHLPRKCPAWLVYLKEASSGILPWALPAKPAVLIPLNSSVSALPSHQARRPVGSTRALAGQETTALEIRTNPAVSHSSNSTKKQNNSKNPHIQSHMPPQSNQYISIGSHSQRETFEIPKVGA